MTACIALRKDVYYVRLTYYDNKHQRKDKWVSTGLHRALERGGQLQAPGGQRKGRLCRRNDPPQSLHPLAQIQRQR